MFGKKVLTGTTEEFCMLFQTNPGSRTRVSVIISLKKSISKSPPTKPGDLVVAIRSNVSICLLLSLADKSHVVVYYALVGTWVSVLL